MLLACMKNSGEDFFLTDLFLKAIAKEAARIAKVKDSELKKVLDFCETQLAYLDTYPVVDDALAVDTSRPGPGLFSTAHSTYKERILERFSRLRKALK